MTDQRPHRRHPVFSPVVTLGSVISFLTVIGSVVGVTLYIGNIQAAVGVNANRISTIERSMDTQAAVTKAEAVAMEARLVRRLERMEDTLNAIRQTQATRTPGQ